MNKLRANGKSELVDSSTEKVTIRQIAYSVLSIYGTHQSGKHVAGVTRILTYLCATELLCTYAAHATQQHTLL